MTKTLKSIDPLQLGKILAILYGSLALLFVPFVLLFTLVETFSQGRPGGAPQNILLGLVFCVILPFVYAAIGFIGGMIMGWVYNLVSKWIGGLKFEVE